MAHGWQVVGTRRMMVIRTTMTYYSSARRHAGDGTKHFMYENIHSRFYGLWSTNGAQQITLLNNPMVPLTFRAIIWLLSLLALALAVSVFQYSNEYRVSQKASTIMAIVVDVVALIYLVWITYDEYSGKPLGLRSPKAKMKLSKQIKMLYVLGTPPTVLTY